MKVLVATHLTQGSDHSDYCWTLDGELVTPIAVPCQKPAECGCGRGFPGLASSRATTTAVVADLAHVGAIELETAVVDSLHRGGWFDHLSEIQQFALVQEHVRAIRSVCDQFGVGTIVCRDGDWVFARESLAA